MVSEGLGGVTAYALMMVFCGFCGFVSAVFQGTSLGFTGQLPVSYVQACYSGQAVAGIIACIIRIITKAAVKSTVSGGRVYYIIGAAFNIFSLIMFLVAMRTPFVQHNLQGYFVRLYARQMKRLGCMLCFCLFLFSFFFCLSLVLVPFAFVSSCYLGAVLLLFCIRIWVYIYYSCCALLSACM